MEILWQSKGKNREKVAVVRVENPEYYGRCPRKKQIPARLYYYKKYHPEENTKGCVIVHLDNDKSNFAEDNLIKISQRAWLLIQNQKLWTDNKEINKTAILITTSQDKNKLLRGKTGKEHS